jgi:hypothetical protein
MYENLFKVLFPLIGRIGMGQKVPHNHGIDWYHVHRRGVEAVIVDMCAKQAKGRQYGDIQNFSWNSNDFFRPWDVFRIYRPYKVMV